MIDVALASLIEDMIEKAGAEGVVEFWQRVGDNLAGRMGKEAYLGWTSFNVAVREAIAKSVTVAGNPLACFLLATRGWSGETKISSKNVVQVNINEDHVRALLRNYECVYALVVRGARIKGE